MPDFTPDPTDALIERLVADLRQARPLRQRNGMALASLALASGALLVVLVLGLRQDFARGRPDPLVLTATGLFLVLALASAWAAVDMARPAVGIRREGWGWTALMAAVLPASALGLVVTDLALGHPVDLDGGGVDCLVLGATMGLATGATLVSWLRRGAPSSPARAGLLTGVASGSAGVFAISLWCPHDTLLHIGVWHGVTVILAGLAGRLLLPKLLAW